MLVGAHADSGKVCMTPGQCLRNLVWIQFKRLEFYTQMGGKKLGQVQIELLIETVSRRQDDHQLATPPIRHGFDHTETEHKHDAKRCEGGNFQG